MATVELTEEQQQFLKECETEFASRYTSDDEDYKAVKSASISVPPILHPWHDKRNQRSNRNGRDFYQNKRHNDSGDGYGRDRKYPDSRSDRRDYQDRRDNYQGRRDHYQGRRDYQSDRGGRYYSY